MRAENRVFRGLVSPTMHMGCIPCRSCITPAMFAADAWFTPDSEDANRSLRFAPAIPVISIAMELPPLLIVHRHLIPVNRLEDAHVPDASGW